MSLLYELKEYCKSADSIDPQCEGVDCVLVEDEIIDNTRWFVVHRAVYHRKTIVHRDPIEFQDEYVAVEYNEPATEYQEWETGSAVVYEVVPEEVTTIVFRRI